LDASKPVKQVPDEGDTIIAVFEVISPEDRFADLYDKLNDYANMGIPQIWIVDPKDGIFKRYQDGVLVATTLFLHKYAFDDKSFSFPVNEITKLVLG
jgi:Putative restriction endonuclease